MSKLKLVESKKEKSNNKQTGFLDEEMLDKLSDMLCEAMPDTLDFRGFESGALEAGNDIVKQALKKNCT